MAGNKKGRKKAGKKTMEKVARQQIYKMIPTKIHMNEATDFKNQNNATPWLCILPATINWSDTNNYERASDTVFIEKCSGYFNLSFSTNTTNRVEVRELMGFYKGSSNPATARSAFNSSTLTTDLPNKMSSWDRDNYFIKHDKKYDLMPLQIYNAGTTGANQPQGIWRSKRIPLTHHLYRKYKYTNSAEGGLSDVVEGTFSGNDTPMGWTPFIALQVRCPDQDFTGGAGANAGPYVDYQFRTTFKDLQ